MPPISSQAGRNDLCPCDSGKKFKHCCLNKTEAEQSLWQRVNAAIKHVQADITGFAGAHFRDLVDFAWSDYEFGAAKGAFDPKSEDFGVFMPYFIYRWQPADGQKLPSGDATIAQAYLRSHGNELNDLERKAVEVGISEPVSFYEVLETRPGEDFVLKELFSGESLPVKERVGSSHVRPGDIIYAQLAPFPGITTMHFCSPLLIPPRYKPDIIAYRRDLQRNYKIRKLTLKHVTRYEEDVRELYLYLRDALTSPPRLANTDGDPYVPHTLTYEVGSAEVAFDALASLAWGMSKEEVLEAGDAAYNADGSLRKVELQWMKKGNRQMKSWENTVLGTLALNGRSLVAEVNSAERAAKLRSEIEKRLGLAAVHKETKTNPIDRAKFAHSGEKDLSLDVSRQRAGAGKTPRGMDQEELLKIPEVREKMRAMMQKQVEDWVRTKIPALGGRTPLQAVKTVDGREMVEALLLDYERTVQQSFPESIRPDMSVLRKLLGLGK